MNDALFINAGYITAFFPFPCDHSKDPKRNNKDSQLVLQTGQGAAMRLFENNRAIYTNKKHNFSCKVKQDCPYALGYPQYLIILWNLLLINCFDISGKSPFSFSTDTFCILIKHLHIYVYLCKIKIQHSQ